uniref:Uncharacterized protein n=1 Tax=Tanacetum cinerariifolium TaxID=118510 RepID=A0A6L2KVK5_TANCI|nr:hypothetical protein [Tanacetum cinerariifolium]
MGILLLRLGLRECLNFLMIHCSQETKTTQANEIDSLKRRVKKLEKKQKSRTHKLKRLYKERISDIDAYEGITLVGTRNDAEMFDADKDLGGEEVFVLKQDENVILKEVDVAQVQVSTAVTTPTISIDEVTLAQALAELKHIKPKAKAKGITDQIQLDEETALKLQADLQAEFDEEQRLARERTQKALEANIALIGTWDDKILCSKRAKEKRNKPPTQAQQGKIMCTHLKNIEGKKLTNLKNKYFDSIQKMFDRAFKRVNTFVDFITELVKGSSKRAGEELTQESAKKQKVDDDKEISYLKQLMKIIPKEEIGIDAILLAVKVKIVIKSYYYKYKEVTAAQDEVIVAQELQRNILNSAHMMVASKVPMLKPGEFEIWRMRIKQYIQMMDYALWDVIENGLTLLKTQVMEGVTTMMPITFVEDNAQRRLKLLKRDLMGMLPQRNLLKQQYENFTTSNSEVLDQTFDRLQKLVSQLELLGEKISLEDVNQKLLRSLSPEWNTLAVVWKNKEDLDTMSMDDLYNNLKVYEPEVKGMSCLSTSIQNMAFVSLSNNNSTNGAVNIAQGVNTAIGVSTYGTQVNKANIDNLSDVVICAFLASQPSSRQLINEDLEQIHPDDLEEIDLKWQMPMLTIRARRFLKKIERKLIVNGNETIGFDRPMWSVTTATKEDTLLESVELQEVKIPSTRNT